MIYSHLFGGKFKMFTSSFTPSVKSQFPNFITYPWFQYL